MQWADEEILRHRHRSDGRAVGMKQLGTTCRIYSVLRSISVACSPLLSTPHSALGCASVLGGTAIEMEAIFQIKD